MTRKPFGHCARLFVTVINKQEKFIDFYMTTKWTHKNIITFKIQNEKQRFYLHYERVLWKKNQGDDCFQAAKIRGVDPAISNLLQGFGANALASISGVTLKVRPVVTQNKTWPIFINRASRYLAIKSAAGRYSCVHHEWAGYALTRRYF